MSALRVGFSTAALLAAAAGAVFAASHFMPGESSVSASYLPSSPQMRRMTEQQYRNTVEDVFSSDISIVGRFEPDVRVAGLAAVGASEASISARGYEQYYAMAGRIADQVVADDNWAVYMPCDSSTRNVFDTECAGQIVDQFGERLFRRKLSDADVGDWVAVTEAAMQQVGDFHVAAGLLIEGMLSSPEFLFITDTVEPVGDAGEVRLTGHAKAARLSYLLWDTAPDDELLRAARSGELHTDEGLRAQVDRMLGSVLVRQGANAFFEDFLHLDAFSTLEKDKLIYPAFNQVVSRDAREQVLKFLDFHLLEKDAPYTEIFEAKETFVTRPLGMIYEVPVRSPDGWEKLTFAKDDPRGGLLSHVGFSALHAHPGRSSATLRGIAVRELLLCQSVAPAPAAVNFTVVQDTENPDFKTARARLTQHRTDDACKSCHEFIDPIGLAMETLDGVGRLRMSENGELIDTTGEIDGFEFENVDGLEGVLAQHPGTASCLVEKMQKYATGRQPSASDIGWIKRLEKKFDREDQRIRPLLRAVALSDEYYAVALPEEDVAGLETTNELHQNPEKKS